jgi:hypothetical protein
MLKTALPHAHPQSIMEWLPLIVITVELTLQLNGWAVDQRGYDHGSTTGPPI